MTQAAAVITGSGVIGAEGIGLDSLAKALRSGRPTLSAVDRSGGTHAAESSRLAALVPKLDLSPWLPPAEARRLSVPSRLAVAASRMALQDARIDSLDGRRVAIVLSTAFGALRFTENLVRQILTEGPESAQPFYFSECVANAAAARVAIALGARGANVTITQREAGPLLALSRGKHEVVSGRADVAIVGAVEEITPLLHGLLDRFRGTARPSRRHDEEARPFDLRRDGIVCAEGATVLVIERESDAGRRGASIRARIGPTVAAFDGTASVSDWGTGGETLARALRAGAAHGGRPLPGVECIVSGSSGARRGDRLEAATLRAAWEGRELPPVLSPKAVTGEYGGGWLATPLLALAGCPMAAPDTFEIDPDVRIAPCDRPIPAPRLVLATALAAGGSAAWAMLERP